MGKVERKVRISSTQKLILDTLRVAGSLSVLVLAPNVLGAMTKLGFKLHPRQTETIKRSKDTLIKRGLIELNNQDLRITKKGRSYLLKCLTLGDQKKLNNERKWDKKWRVLVFDIPESKRFDRDSIRNALISIGFLMLQNSVWVYPYNCEDIVSLLKAETETDRDLLYMVVESIENEEELKKHFRL